MPRFLPTPDGQWPAWTGWAARVAVSLLLPWALWRELGPIGLVFAAPGLGAVWARPLVEAGMAAWSRGRSRGLDDLPGRVYGFGGRELRIVTDGQGRHWVPSAEVRRAGIALPPDAVLAARLRPDHRAPALHPRDGLLLRVDVLADDLVHASERRTVRFARWLRSEVLRQRPG